MRVSFKDLWSCPVLCLQVVAFYKSSVQEQLCSHLVNARPWCSCLSDGTASTSSRANSSCEALLVYNPASMKKQMQKMHVFCCWKTRVWHSCVWSLRRVQLVPSWSCLSEHDWRTQQSITCIPLNLLTWFMCAYCCEQIVKQGNCM